MPIRMDGGGLTAPFGAKYVSSVWLSPAIHSRFMCGSESVWKYCEDQGQMVEPGVGRSS